MFNRQCFAASIETHCEKHKLSLRDAARQSGVSASTLSRLVSGEKTPDMEIFERLCAWMKLEPAHFFPGSLERTVHLELASLPLVCAILRADRQIAEESREKLVDLLKAAYVCLTERNA